MGFNRVKAEPRILVQQAASIEGDLMAAFPNGTWPNPVVANFSDASMGRDTTGPKDDSDWRLRP